MRRRKNALVDISHSAISPSIITNTSLGSTCENYCVSERRSRRVQFSPLTQRRNDIWQEFFSQTVFFFLWNVFIGAAVTGALVDGHAGWWRKAYYKKWCLSSEWGRPNRIQCHKRTLTQFWAAWAGWYCAPPKIIILERDTHVTAQSPNGKIAVA